MRGCMRRKLIIDGNAVYEIDDECICRKEAQQIPDRDNRGSSGQRMTDTSGRNISAHRKNEDGDDTEQRESIWIRQCNE